MEIALPILNYTVRSFGAFAKPFVVDAIEQSNAGLRAAMLQADEQYLDALKEVYFKQLDPITRATYAVRMKNFEQTMRRLALKMDRCQEEKSAAEARLNVAQQLEAEAKANISVLNLKLASLKDNIKLVNRCLFSTFCCSNSDACHIRLIDNTALTVAEQSINCPLSIYPVWHACVYYVHNYL